MHSIDVIKNVCAAAIEQAEEGENWRPGYCSIIDPLTVLELVQRIEHLEQMDRAMSEDELRALGQLIRDLLPISIGR